MAASGLDKVLVINSGSSSLKFMMFSMRTETMLAKGVIERIGSAEATLTYQRDGEQKTTEGVRAENHGQALEQVSAMLTHPARGILK